jgi:hypothetical protein
MKPIKKYIWGDYEKNLFILNNNNDELMKK